MGLSLPPPTMSTGSAQRKRKTRRPWRTSLASGFFSFLPFVIPALPWPIKGKAGHPTKGMDSSQHIIAEPLALNLEQLAKQRPSSRHLFDLSIRDLGSVPLLPVCNPYYELFSANNTSNNHELDVGTFRPNQYKPCVFFSTLSRPDAQ